jgi:hypothetical protein
MPRKRGTIRARRLVTPTGAVCPAGAAYVCRRRLKTSAASPRNSVAMPVAPPPPPLAGGGGGGGATVVVDVNVLATPPMVSVVFCAVLNSDDDVCRTHTVSFSLMVASSVTNVSLQPIEYWPLATVIRAGASIPVIVSVLEVSTTLRTTSV